MIIRSITAQDDSQVAKLIRTVMPEFGASGPGFAIHDPEVDFMTKAYSGPRAGYFVLEDNKRIVGGGGFAPLQGANPDVCELRKMYFLSETRGKGYGKKMLDQILVAAREAGFKTCYLETFETMTQAHRLYERSGFKRLNSAMGCTGHSACNMWYAIDL